MFVVTFPLERINRLSLRLVMSPFTACLKTEHGRRQSGVERQRVTS